MSRIFILDISLAKELSAMISFFVKKKDLTPFPPSPFLAVSIMGAIEDSTYKERYLISAEV